MSVAHLSASLSTLLIALQLLGGLLMTWGGARLIQGLRGEGQSAEGVALLRAELLGLVSPLLFGAVAVSALLGLAMWERSPLTGWVQVIAPLSTMIWVIWSHYRARKLRSGELFEALVPLSMNLSAQLDQRAKSWVENSPPLSSRGLMHTAFQAAQDAQGEQTSRRPLSFEVTLQITQDSLRELHEATLRFPLGQQLTLTDWIYEGERLTRHWGVGLKWISRGRALINPLTLLDHQGLWRWSKGSPAELFQRELAAWLHRGLYVLVSQKVTAHLMSEEAEGSSRSEELAQRASARLSDEASKLWSLMAFKFTVPFWLYFGLSAIAAVEGHGLLGLGISAMVGLLWWRSARRASALEAWRAAFRRLSTHKRAPLPSEGRVADEVRGVLMRLTEEFEGTLRAQQAPCEGLMTFTHQGWSELSRAYRRPLPELSDPNPVLDHLNITLPDLIATLYWLCDDLKRFSDSTAGSLLKTLTEHLGGKLTQGFEPMLLEVVRRWSLEDESSQISSHDLELERDPERDTTCDAEEVDALTRGARSGDLWVQQNIYEAGFLIRTVGVPLLNSAAEGLQRWVKEELSTRLTALYRGEVPAPSASATLKSAEA